MRFFIFILFLINDSIYCHIDWKDGNWALACDFPENDIENANTSGEDCSNKCKQTNSCTHFTWTTWNGGTCWMKGGPSSKNDAIFTNDNSMVCGVLKNQGKGIQKGDLVWSDDFNNNGKPDSSKWRLETGGNGWGNNEAQFYTDSQNNAYTTGGNLVIEAKKEDFGGKKYTSARLITNQKFKYGVFEMRAKLPQGRGTWPAFWLLAAKRPLDWPRDGEIDVMEHVGYDPAAVHGI